LKPRSYVQVATKPLLRRKDNNEYLKAYMRYLEQKNPIVLILLLMDLHISKRAELGTPLVSV
jgi:hypothetical protein